MSHYSNRLFSVLTVLLLPLLPARAVEPRPFSYEPPPEKPSALGRVWGSVKNGASKVGDATGNLFRTGRDAAGDTARVAADTASDTTRDTRRATGNALSRTGEVIGDGFSTAGRALADGAGAVGDGAVAAGKFLARPLTKLADSGENKPLPGQVAWRSLKVSIATDPARIKLTGPRQFTALVRVTNEGKRLAQLEFANSQRIDVLLRDATGRVIERWSDDQPIDPEPTLITINPDERLEYAAVLSTRDLQPGQRYTIEAFMLRYNELRAERVIVPEAAP